MTLDYVSNWSEKMNGSHKPMSENEYSVTELLKDATAIVLKRRHSKEIQKDIQAFADINAGTAVHESLEESARECGWETEKELSIVIKPEDGERFTLYGKLDLYRDGVLADIKNTKEASVNKAVSGQDDDWRKQLTAYVIMADTMRPDWYKGLDDMQIHARITDLSVVGNAKTGKSTDKWRVIHYDIPTHAQTDALVDEFIDKVTQVRKLSKLRDNKLPMCSDKYRFAETKYKIYGKTKSGEWKKTAEVGHANYPTAYEAKQGFEKAGFTEADHRILEVGGESLRCKYFCEVKEFCPHYKKMMEVGNETSESK